MNLVTKQSLRDYVLTEEQQAQVLSKMTRRDRVLLEFLFATGARISEALSIELRAIRRDENTAVITICGKGNKIRRLRVAEDLLHRIRVTYGGNSYLFESSNGKPLDRSYVYKRVSKAAAEVGLRFSPHCARHTFSTRMIAQTGKIEAVSRYLGHSSPAITLSMYCHESLSDEELGLR